MNRCKSIQVLSREPQVYRCTIKADDILFLAEKFDSPQALDGFCIVYFRNGMALETKSSYEELLSWWMDGEKINPGR